MLIGSPEWFYEQSQMEYNTQLVEMLNKRRKNFISQFGPDKLLAMDGKTLLKRVFGPSDSSMMRVLMFDDDCRWFGAAGKYVYVAGVYYDQGRQTWKYKRGQNAESISSEMAEEKAVYIRDQLIECIRSIENIGDFTSINDYKRLQKNLSKVFFSQYAWALKYYQMVFPEFFPGMYADYTIYRAIQILGLREHGAGNRIQNAGEIALFIRRCNTNCIIFNNIYGTHWGWEKEWPACEAAYENYKLCASPVKRINR